MPLLQVVCPCCRALLTVPADLPSGTNIQCPKCKMVMATQSTPLAPPAKRDAAPQPKQPPAAAKKPMKPGSVAGSPKATSPQKTPVEKQRPRRRPAGLTLASILSMLAALAGIVLGLLGVILYVRILDKGIGAHVIAQV